MTPVLGTVVEFDEHRGLGVIEGDDGERYPFHCTRIADGSRVVPEGARVEFTVMAGPAGRWEADAIASAPSA
ncbi:MAG: cold shock domain-containing protein [Actinomycetes bacterium]